jgi:hypothetical protein
MHIPTRGTQEISSGSTHGPQSLTFKCIGVRGWREWNRPRAVLANKSGKLVKCCHVAPIRVGIRGSLWPPKSARSSGLTPHKRPLGQHSKFCVRLFEFIRLRYAPNVQFCSFWRRLNHLWFHSFSVCCEGHDYSAQQTSFVGISFT